MACSRLSRNSLPQTLLVMKDTPPDRVRLGAFEVDLRAGELRNGAGPIYLQDQPLIVLRMLVGRGGEVVTREEIKEQLWPDDTVVDFDRGINTTVRRLRQSLGDVAEEPKYVATVARRGYRLLVPVEPLDPAAKTPSPAAADTSVEPAERGFPRTGRRWFILGGIVVAGIIAGTIFSNARRPPRLTDRDTIVLADFDNKTGDPVFDDTLKQGLTIQLEQSPFLNILPNRKVRQTLKLMNRSAGDPLKEDVAREVCQRTGSKAVLAGSIAQLGGEYVIGLRAVDCNYGDALVDLQERAANKEGVLNALDKAGTQMRSKLGESLSSVERYATPLFEATTPSLDALKAYSTAGKIQYVEGSTASLPFYRRAVELDPNFAMAFNNLAIQYFNLNEGQRAQECARKAYELRGKVSERERLAIEANYYNNVTGELDKAAQAYELWQQNYPKDVAPVGNLGTVASKLGDMEKLLSQVRKALDMEPNYGVIYADLAAAEMNLNRLEEAEQAFRQAEQHGVGEEVLLQYWYLLAFLKNDQAKMSKLLATGMGKPGVEDLMFAAEADTGGWYGKFKDARQFTGRAVEVAKRNDAKETAATYAAAAAVREVAAGNRAQARANAKVALELSGSRDVKAIAALALVQAGDLAEAQKRARELDSTFPLDTLVQRYWLPTIGGAVALKRNDPKKAIELLSGMGPIELGVVNDAINVYLCPAYLRGQAYLMLHDGKAAAAEFQKFIDHYGVITNFPWGALARLGIARAYALEAQTDPAYREKARTAYQNFLTLWKDADPDIPIYKQAKAEYAKLQ